MFVIVKQIKKSNHVMCYYVFNKKNKTQRKNTN